MCVSEQEADRVRVCVCVCLPEIKGSESEVSPIAGEPRCACVYVCVRPLWLLPRPPSHQQTMETRPTQSNEQCTVVSVCVRVRARACVFVSMGASDKR